MILEHAFKNVLISIYYNVSSGLKITFYFTLDFFQLHTRIYLLYLIKGYKSWIFFQHIFFITFLRSPPTRFVLTESDRAFIIIWRLAKKKSLDRPKIIIVNECRDKNNEPSIFGIVYIYIMTFIKYTMHFSLQYNVFIFFFSETRRQKPEIVVPCVRPTMPREFFIFF